MIHLLSMSPDYRFRRTRGALAPALVAVLIALAGCGGPDDAGAGEPASDEASGEVSRTPGTEYVVNDSAIAATIEAAGTAEPVLQSTLSTKLMSIVEGVRVHEGDRVAGGQVLVELDARDLDARRAQVNANIADAEAMNREAEAHLRRIQALYADSAATRVQLEAAETGAARASAAAVATTAPLLNAPSFILDSFLLFTRPITPCRRPASTRANGGAFPRST